MSDDLQDLYSESSSTESTESETDMKEEEEFNEPMPDLELITLISSDDRKFHLQKKIAYVSGFLSNILQSGTDFKDTKNNEIKFTNIRGKVLDRVIDFMHYNYLYKDYPKEPPHFEISDDILIELLIASDFLQL